ncbi:MAG: winged helix-turn-helix domain-containing protein [archaeon GB-1867-005]|nr:winged helix-turn-helix domain-containing protein [Candidatus Culexmicrobium cathedralense]
MARRSRFEIYLDILEAVAEGNKKPTHIMYRANLSWIRLKKYLNFLISRGLLRQSTNASTCTFSLTRKGREVLAYYKRLERLFHREERKVFYPKIYVRYN